MAQKKILIIRFSSLGDIVLSQWGISELLNYFEVHFLLKKENQIAMVATDLLASPFEHRSKLQPLFFQKQENESSFQALLRISRKIESNEYNYIIDLHSVLKSKGIRIILFFLRIQSFLFHRKTRENYQWITLKKPRISRLFYSLLKKYCPMFLRPQSYSLQVQNVFKKVIDQSVKKIESKKFFKSEESKPHLAGISHAKQFIGISPGSAWESKQWPSQSFIALIQNLMKQGLEPILFGSEKDSQILMIKKNLEELHLNVQWCLSETNSIRLREKIRQCELIVSNDSFMAHLAESYEIPVVMIFGPTQPDYGYGPRLKESISVVSSLWCSPCSKDGTLCFRMGSQRFKCIQQISVNMVLDSIQKVRSLLQENHLTRSLE